MSLINRSFLAYASSILRKLDEGRKNPALIQQNTFTKLIKGGTDSYFGALYGFSNIKSIENYQKCVPIRDYNEIKKYVDMLRKGREYTLWGEKTSFFAKSSGTSSDKSKFIPLTPTNISGCHYRGMIMMLSNYVNLYPQTNIFRGKALTLGGSVAPDISSNTFSGDLSAILLKKSPSLAEMVRVPDKKTAMLHDFDQKIEKICKTCSKSNVTSFSGVPSWNLIMLKRLIEHNKVDYVTDIWPNLELFMHGGINFEPYRKQFDNIIPDNVVKYFENYNASEGYFAFQDDPKEKGMLLTLDNGVFYEFIPIKDFNATLKSNIQTTPLCIEDVKIGEPYAIIISTSAGLWRYMIGDVVEFTSIFPHKIIIVGRTQLYINAFGEELMISNAENALNFACNICNATISDYTVAPIFMSEKNNGSHQWVIEFYKNPENIDNFADVLDKALCEYNSDYEAKRIHTHTMNKLTLSVVPPGTFYNWMKQRGKIGGQNKVPRLSGERTYVDQLLSLANKKQATRE